MTDTETLLNDLVSFYGEGGIVPTRQQWKKIIENTHSGPICMINFMKMREKALYPDIVDTDLTGLEAVLRYFEVGHKKVLEVGGEFVVQGFHGGTVIGNEEDWDMVGIVRYSNRDAFVKLFTDPEYREGHRHRVAATLRHRMVMLLEAPI